jgi:protein mago nashi
MSGYDDSIVNEGQARDGGDRDDGPAAASGEEEVQLPDFYLRYYVGHAGRFGHEFLEYEVREDGTIRYGNHSKYRDKSSAASASGLLKKRVKVAPLVLEEFQRMVRNSGILTLTRPDTWPPADRAGRQELEIVIDGKHLQYVTNMTCQMTDIRKLQDAEGFERFFYLVLNSKQLVLTLIGMHHRIKPV